jgi:acyl carrier protein phosphodiesterase
MNREGLLKLFMDKTRLQRINEVRDDEVTMEEASDQFVKAKVREYNVTIDVSKRFIQHDCADWNRVSPARQFCKHVGKVMMMLSEDAAVNILKAMSTELERWAFKPVEP